MIMIKPIDFEIESNHSIQNVRIQEIASEFFQVNLSLKRNESLSSN